MRSGLWFRPRSALGRCGPGRVPEQSYYTGRAGWRAPCVRAPQGVEGGGPAALAAVRGQEGWRGRGARPAWRRPPRGKAGGSGALGCSEAGLGRRLDAPRDPGGGRRARGAEAREVPHARGSRLRTRSTGPQPGEGTRLGGQTEGGAAPRVGAQRADGGVTRVRRPCVCTTDCEAVAWLHVTR